MNLIKNNDMLRYVPMRMCVICRKRLPQGELARYVLAVDGRLQLDEPVKLPGRGWYCCSDPVCRTKFAHYKIKRKAGKGGNRLPGQGEI